MVAEDDLERAQAALEEIEKVRPTPEELEAAMKAAEESAGEDAEEP